MSSALTQLGLTSLPYPTSRAGLNTYTGKRSLFQSLVSLNKQKRRNASVSNKKLSVEK